MPENSAIVSLEYNKEITSDNSNDVYEEWKKIILQ